MTSTLEQAYEHVVDVTEAAPLQGALGKSVMRKIGQVEKYNPYIQTDEARKTLQTFGIGVHPRPVEEHSHPACKAIENYMLVQAGQHLDEEATCCFMKAKKLELLFRGRPVPNVQLLNEYITPKDLSRYGQDVITNVLMHIDTETGFVHDAMHYYNPDILGHIFDENPKLQKLVYTVVIPPEIQARDRSLYPELYTIHYPVECPNRFEFWPDGHSAGLYQQEIKCAEWLYLGRVVGTHSVVTVDKLESYGAHHLFVAVRGKKRIDPVRSYPCKDLVEMPKLWVTDSMDERMGVSRSLLMRLYEYGRSLKQVDERDLVAKLRQILSTKDLANMDIMTLEWLVQVVLMMLQMQKIPKAKLLAGTTALERWTERAKSSLYEWCQAFVGMTTSSQVFKQAAGLRPYNFDGPTTIRGVMSTFVRFHIGKKRVRVSKTGKRKAYAVNVHRLAQEMPEVEEEFEHEKLVRSVGREVGVVGRDVDRLIQEMLPADSMSDSTLDANHQHAGEAALETLMEDCGHSSPEGSDAGIETMMDYFPQAETCDAGTSHEQGPDTEIAARLQVLPSERLVDAVPLTSPTREQPKVPNPEKGDYEPANSGCVKWVPSAYSDEALQIISKYGVRIKKQEVDGQGELIDPLWVQEIDHKQRKDDQVQGNPVAKQIVQSLNAVGRHVYEHQADARRAAAYASDLQYGSVGTLRSDPKFGPRLEGLKKRCQRTTEKALVAVLLGAGGAGKSHQLQQVLHKLGGSLSDVTVIAPTRVLRDEWVNTFPKARPDSILTYERAFNKPLGSVLILDDFGKLPHGYVDVLITHKPTIELVVLTGDFRQSVYHEQNQEAAIAGLPAEMDVFAKYADYYLNLTRRCPRIVSKALGIFPANDEVGKVARVDHMPNSVPVLVPSVKQRDALITTGKEVYTYAGSQGITRPRVTVLLTSDTRWCDERTMYTAFSRAKQVIYLTEDTLGDAQFQSKLEATPYLKTLLRLVREPEVLDASPPASVVRETTPRTHLPVETDRAIGDDLVEKLGPTEDREIYTEEHGRTEVYKSEVGEQNRMQHHQAKDDALVSVSYKKRLRHQTIGANQKEFRNTRRAGVILFESFRKAYDLPVEPRKFDQKLWDQCEQEVEGRYLQKTEAQIKQGEERQDPDFDANFIKLFLKSQRIKKDEKYGLEQAKAGQPITSFKQQTVMRTGVLSRYVRRVMQQLQPENVYIHTEQSDLDFHKWVRDHWDFTQKSYESDYTMYDQSQGGECLNFELMLCRYAGVPAAEMQFYSALKTRSEVYSGILKIMRLSGEGPTFDFNTFCNIAYHHTKYVIPKGTPQCFAGDDMAQCGIPVERSNWSKIQSMFQLVAKPIVSDYPGFIGFRLTPFGVVRSPLKLYRSLRLAEELGNINETLEAYSRDIYYMYCLGEGAMDGNIFTEDEITAHWLALRMIHRLNYKPIRPEGADGILPTPANEDEDNPNDWLTNARYRLQGKSSTKRRNALRYRKNRA